MRVVAASVHSVLSPDEALGWWQRYVACDIIMSTMWPNNWAMLQRHWQGDLALVVCDDSQGEELRALVGNGVGYAMGFCKDSVLARARQRVRFPRAVLMQAPRAVRDHVDEQWEGMCGFTWCAWYDPAAGAWQVPAELAEGEGALSDELEYFDIATGGWGPIASRLFDDYCNRAAEVAQLLALVVGDRPDWSRIEGLAGHERIEAVRRAAEGVWPT